MTNHGGKRVGAGAPTLYARALRRYMIRLTAEQWEWLRNRGKGNRSQAVRDFIDRASAREAKRGQQ